MLVNRIEVVREEWSILTVEAFRDECMAKSVNGKEKILRRFTPVGCVLPRAGSMTGRHHRYPAGPAVAAERRLGCSAPGLLETRLDLRVMHYDLAFCAPLWARGSWALWL